MKKKGSIDIHNYKGLLKTSDGQEVFVDNISNNGWNKNSFKGCVFMDSDLRSCRFTEVERLHTKLIIDACLHNMKQ